MKHTMTFEKCKPCQFSQAKYGEVFRNREGNNVQQFFITCVLTGNVLVISKCPYDKEENNEIR